MVHRCHTLPDAALARSHGQRPGRPAGRRAAAGRGAAQPTEAPPPATLAAPTFTDVAGSTHEPAIAQLVELGITQGTTLTTYGPAHPVTRGQMATFLVRLLAAWQVALPDDPNDPADTDAAGFVDIAGTTHEASIRQVAAAGIAQGIDEQRFAPDAIVRRDQMASFLTRTLSYALDTDLDDADATAFEDIDGNVHATSIAQLVAAGITQGTSPTTYEPAAAVRRDQMASFLIRTGELLTAELDRQPQPIGQDPTEPPAPDDTPAPDGESGTGTPVRPPRDASGDEPVEVIVADDTVVLEGGTDSPVRAYDPTGGEVILDASLADEVELGSVLVADVSDAAPDGLLRQVTATELAGDELILATEQATLTDVFDQADIYLREAIDFTTITEVETFIDGIEIATADGVVAGEDVTSAAAPRSDGGLDAEVAVNCDLTSPNSPETLRMRFGCGTEASVVFEASAATSDDDEDEQCNIDEGCVSAQAAGRAEVTGTLDLSVDFVTDLQLRFGLVPIELFEAYLEHQVDANLAFTSEFTAGFEAEQRVARLNMGARTFLVGAVPVVVTPRIDIFLGADGSFEAKATWEASYAQRTVAGVGYQHQRGWDTIWIPPDPQVNIEDFEAEARGEARGWVRGRVTPEFYGVVGPYFELRPYLRGELETALSLGQTNAFGAEVALFLGLDGSAGVDLTIPVIDYELGHSTSFQVGEIELLRRTFEFASRFIVVGGDAVDLSEDASGRISRFRFNAQQGDVLDVGVLGLPESSGARIEVYDPSGQRIGMRQQTRTESRFAVMMAHGIQIPQAGLYRMVVQAPPDTEAAGQLYLSRAQTTLVDFDGDPVALADDLRPGQSVRVGFTAPAGRLIDIALTDLTYERRTFSNVRLRLVGSDGQNLARENQRANRRDETILLDTTRLPSAGTHTVIVSPPVDGTPLPGGTIWISSRARITAEVDGSSVELPAGLRPGQSVAATFEGNGADLVDVALTGLTYERRTFSNVRLHLRGTDGQRLAAENQRSHRRDEAILLDTTRLPSAGTHTVVAYPPHDGTPLTDGTIWISTPVQRTTTIDGSAATLPEGLRPGQSVRFTFEGSAGQLVDAALTELTYPRIFGSQIGLVLLDPDDERLASGSQSVRVPEQIVLEEVALSQTGAHTAVVRPPFSGTPLDDGLLQVTSAS